MSLNSLSINNISCLFLNSINIKYNCQVTFENTFYRIFMGHLFDEYINIFMGNWSSFGGQRCPVSPGQFMVGKG